jgi:MFS family permease
LAVLAVGENSTAIMAALPAMATTLLLRPPAVEWVVNAYLLAAAAFIILGGDAADRFSPSRSSAVGVAVFALASTGIALAPNGLVVSAARALQGLGAAFAIAGTLALVTNNAPEPARPRAVGIWTGFLMLGFSVGPLVGGIVTHYLGWRANFWLNSVVMFPVALALALQPGAQVKKSGSVDWLGLALLVAFATMLISGLRALPQLSSSPFDAAIPLMLAALIGAALPWAERRNPRPLLDFDLFANTDFLIACLLGFFLMLDIMTLLLYYNLFAQKPDGLALTPEAAGISLVPLSVAFFLFARTAPGLAVAVGLRRMMIGGAMLLALGCAIVWAAARGAGSFVQSLGLVAVGAGIAMPYATAPRIGLATLPQTQVGQGSGVLNSCSFLGGTVGVTCGGLVFDLAGFSAVLLLIMGSALAGACLAMRLRTR